MMSLLTNLFPLWVLLALVVGLIQPDAFIWFDPYIVPGLAVIMLGMGMTLTASDFAGVLRRPRAVAFGLLAQFGIMPPLGYAAAVVFDLPRDLAVGVILVSCCPGGTASNVVTYLARANVPLSVLMTLASTVAAIGMTPLLTGWLAGTYVAVDVLGLLQSVLLVVLLPLILGLALHELTPGLVRRVLPIAPLISVLTIALICGAIVGKSATHISASGFDLVGALLMLHLGGFALGYTLARVSRYAEADARTVSIEVGMQNSGLGAALAKQHFTPETAVPCAISAVMHSVIGSLLAGLWRLLSPRAATEE
ncbi:MAG: bile acid:sodium symporter family protein [Bacteroidales bacterium]|nr:bile acid:sodium symporter family protein [Bacteroidales bacterium]